MYLVRPQVLDRDADVLRPAVHGLRVLRRGDVGRVAVVAVDPVAAVEGRQVLGLPVRRALGAHAQHLAPVARPVQRAVGVVPRVGRRLRRRGVQRPRLVVEPRRVGVDQRRDQHPGDHDHDRHRAREPHVAHPQPLQPQEGEHEHRQHRAAQELAREAERHRRHGVEDDEQQQREPGHAQLPVAPRPERGERGDDDQRRPADRDDELDPRVDPAVGHAHARQRLDAARDPRGELVPVRRVQQRPRDPAGEHRQHERDDRDADAGDVRPAARQPPRAPQRGRGRQRDQQRERPAPRHAGREQRHPVQHGEAREQQERDPARDRQRERRVPCVARVHQPVPVDAAARAAAAPVRVAT